MTSTLTALGEELDLTEHEVFMAAVIAALTAERDAARAEVARLKDGEERHKRLCLADLGGDGVWPCGCHHLIVDSYGSRKLLTAADGETHAECDDHAALRAEVERLREELEALRTSTNADERQYLEMCQEKDRRVAELEAQE